MRFLIVLLLCVVAATALSKTDSTSVSLADTLHSEVLITDSLKVDSLKSANTPIDTIRHDQTGVTSDSLASKKVLTKVESPDKGGPKLIKRTYEFKSQVRVGILMMIFIGLIFFTAQSLNP